MKMSRSDQQPIKMHTNQIFECICVNVCPMAIDSSPIDFRNESHRTHPNVSSLEMVKENKNKNWN